MKLRQILQDLLNLSLKIGCDTPWIVGGTARDRIIGNLKNIADLDICNGSSNINYLAEEYFNKLKNEVNITKKTNGEGKESHISLFVGNLKLDFSSNFIDPHVLKVLPVNATGLQKEVFSRDFLCNSLLLSLDLKKTLDLTGKGIQSIEDKIIKTCLPPEITLTSNKNRVIRSIYLACKLDFNIDQSIIDFVSKNPKSLTEHSSQHVLVEKLNLAFSKNSQKAVDLIDSMNLWNYIPITEIMQPYYIKQQGKSLNVKKI